MRIPLVVLVAACGSDPSSPPIADATARCTDVQVIVGNWTLTGRDQVSAAVPAGCYQIDGSLTVTGPAITTLAPLGDLRGVRDLIIDDTRLTTIDTLSPLRVTGSIAVNHNQVLVDLGKLEVSPGDTLGSVSVKFDPQLRDLDRLSQVGAIEGGLEIGLADALTSIALPEVDRIEGGLRIHDNDALIAIDLPGITSITGDLTIQNNPAWAELALWELHVVHGNVVIDNNDALDELPGVSAPESIDGNLQITNNATLTGIGAFLRATQVRGRLEVVDNPSLHYDPHSLHWCTAASGCTVTY